MSPEAEATNNATNQTDDPPTNPPKVIDSLPIETPEEDSARKDRAISHIIPAAKNHPEVYQYVVSQINNASLRRNWATTLFNKDFMAWCRTSNADARPDLKFLVAALAVYDSFGTTTSRFGGVVMERGLRDWAIQQLEKRHLSSSTAESASPETPKEAPKKVPKVKMEEGARGEGLVNAVPPQVRVGNVDGRIRQSIEFDFNDPIAAQTYFEPPLAVVPPAVAGSLKRQAPSHSTEQARKKIKPEVDHEAIFAAEIKRLAAVEAIPQRIVLRDAGTQTDSDMSAQWAISLVSRITSEPLLKATDAMMLRTEALEEHTYAIENHTQALAELPAKIREAIQNTVQNTIQNTIHNPVHRPVGDVIRHGDNTYRQQLQIQSQPSSHEIVPIQPIQRQPTAFFYEPAPREPNNGTIYRYG
ncbi:hypothetical protein FSARC_3858 [Fusarium sarcochroum]|uniref:Uncharacterized protein n=1 Tax=Fusarium sarcochroum TaxID=1208366 RepID=A0A8H4U3I1_9HYPO|nr:hypothetical protein FSARC_3858 [Fusarium sarcochroum]